MTVRSGYGKSPEDKIKLLGHIRIYTYGCPSAKTPSHARRRSPGYSGQPGPFGRQINVAAAIQTTFDRVTSAPGVSRAPRYNENQLSSE
jgi:hypothetical protein